jgi:hypothetical protein
LEQAHYHNICGKLNNNIAAARIFHVPAACIEGIERIHLDNEENVLG